MLGYPSFFIHGKISTYQHISILVAGCVFKVITVVVWGSNRNVEGSGRLRLLEAGLMKMVPAASSRSSRLSVLAGPLPHKKWLLRTEKEILIL